MRVVASQITGYLTVEQLFRIAMKKISKLGIADHFLGEYTSDWWKRASNDVESISIMDNGVCHFVPKQAT